MWRAKNGPVPWWLIPLAALVFDLVVIALLQPRGPVRDEVVFFPAAQAFARAGLFPSLEFLRHYPAPQAPLSLYLAGRVLAIAPRLWLLRVIDCSLMASALLRFARFAQQCCDRYATLAIALLALNPYFHLSATHFYTDALYFWLVVQVVTRGRWQSRGLHAVYLGLVPLTRQFGIIFPIGEALQAVTERRFRAALAALLTLAPLLALVVLWHGFAPDTPRAEIPRTVHAVYGWFFPYVASYHVAALGFYLAPVAACIPRTWRFWTAGVGFAIFYLLAPAHQNFSAELAGSGIATLGYFQRAALVLGPRGASCVLFSFAFLGGGLVGESLAGRGAWRFFVVLFVVLSAFNFQAWDKYLLDVLPAGILALLARAPAAQSRFWHTKLNTPS
ncbi:MAG TPA: hypothetical protein VK745_12925 [Polyangiaceae bacterium]|jgi:hypothetical protein|nr:hypothetical protein [Polyangiaceae bacterium]